MPVLCWQECFDEKPLARVSYNSNRSDKMFHLHPEPISCTRHVGHYSGKSTSPTKEYVHKELQRSGVTLNLLWLEYCDQCRAAGEIPYQSTQFNKYYAEYLAKVNATMHLNHKPGEVMQVDWAGNTAAVIDTDTGEIIPPYVFVATLPYSGYSYVEAFFSMNQKLWTAAHVNAYKYFGGVTRIIQCDNLKTGVQKHGKDEAVLNKPYQDLALLIKHTTTYKEPKPLYSEYKKSRDKEKYLRGHEREIILFEASARALKAAGVGDKLSDLAKLREEYSRLSEEKDRLYAEYGSLKKRMREYDAVKQNIDSILSPNRGQEQDKAL